jgi:hypothetical protein
MKYYVFIDESGDHGLKNIDKNFPVFVLCGIVFSEYQFIKFNTKMDKLKMDLWNSKQVIFHSRDIRKCEKEFQILFDLKKKEYFYNEINSIIESSDFTVISSVINKDDYIKKYGKLGNIFIFYY